MQRRGLKVMDSTSLCLAGGPAGRKNLLDLGPLRFYHQPVLAWSSQPLAGRSHAYWRRRDQEGSGLLGPRDREDAKVRGMAQAHSLPERMREGPREVGGRTEDVMRKAVWEEELGMAGPAKWQNVGPGSWNQPRKLGRQMSDGIGEKLFQDLHPFVRGEHMLSKGKSQSLPRVLSPESLSCIDIPIPLSDGPLAAVPKGPFHSPNRAPDLEAARNPEKGGSSAPSPRPKFGRPIKPPSYDSHQYSRAGAEISDLTASQPPDPRASHPAKTKDTRQELGVPDPGLEPPGAGQAHPGVDSRGRGTSPVPRGEVVKGETTGPCNSQQLFGQFLLKPVSRRPWDLISQLESFNKELQEEEASSRSSSSSEDGETGQPWEGRAGPAAQHAGCCEDRVEEAPRRLVAEDPGPWWGSVTRSSIAGEGDQEVEDGVTEPAVSPGPAKQVTSSRLSDAMPVSPVDPAEAREPLLSQEPPGGLSAPELSEASPSRAGGGEQGSSGVLVSLSLTGKLRGLSAPDLRSVGLTLAQERSASTVAGSSGEASAIEIPPNESLQARAARILGIEVAMESLLPGAGRVGQSQHPEPDGGTHGPESPGQESVSSPACRDEPSASTDAFHGRRKCGWTTSPLFVGERDVPRRAPQASEPKGVDGDTLIPSQAPEPQPSLQEPQPFHPKDVGTKPPFRSTLFHFIERTPSLAASEKRLRSTSKVIESLQEKLASPPRRADPDRLMRMKEVSSVSRLRLLTSRGTESAEEAEEPTAEKSSRVRPLNARHLLSESRGAFPLGEDGHQAARREENGGQDFWCPARPEEEGAAPCFLLPYTLCTAGPRRALFTSTGLRKQGPVRAETHVAEVRHENQRSPPWRGAVTYRSERTLNSFTCSAQMCKQTLNNNTCILFTQQPEPKGSVAGV
ncbi:junctional protein associated with coronary artery disease-like protein [Camelus ferus]|nr:junctional protein associated with coronary artery disease-like protein [Camelus ferus]